MTENSRRKISQRLNFSLSDQLSMLLIFGKNAAARKENPNSLTFLVMDAVPIRGYKNGASCIHQKKLKEAILNKRNQLRSLNISDIQEADELFLQKRISQWSINDIWILVLSKEQEDF